MAHTQAELHDEVHRIFNLALSLFPAFRAAYPNPPIVKFFTKGSTAGWCKGGRIIELNTTMASMSENIFKLTIPHEVAHMVCQLAPVYGKNHNKGWKRVCIMLGGDGERAYAAGERGTIIPGRRTTQYLYQNQNDAQVWLGAVHHKRVQSIPGYAVRNAERQRFDKDDFMHQSKIKGS